MRSITHKDTHIGQVSSGRGIGTSQTPLPAQHTTYTRDKLSWPRRDSNPQSQQYSYHKPRDYRERQTTVFCSYWLKTVIWCEESLVWLRLVMHLQVTYKPKHSVTVGIIVNCSEQSIWLEGSCTIERLPHSKSTHVPHWRKLQNLLKLALTKF